MSMYSSDAAEQVVRMTLDGTEVAIKVAGTGAKKLLAIILAILTETKKSKGKVWLSTMLKAGKELKVLAVKDSEVAKFQKEAATYGITYTILKDRSVEDGITDVLVKAEDIPRINRLFARFQLTNIDLQDIHAGIIAEAVTTNKEAKTLTKNEKLEEYLNNILPENKKQEAQKANPENGLTAEPRQSRPISKETQTQALPKESVQFEKPSVKDEIDKLSKTERSSDGVPEKNRGKNKSGPSKGKHYTKNKDRGAR